MMKRMEEYEALRKELENIPPALSYTVSRAEAKVRRRRRFRLLFAIPVSSLLIFSIAFIITINLSTSFAYACGRIPLLRDLASAVAFSPSLSAAVKNEYVQPIDLVQTKDGITMRVEYLIVDQKQLNIFYTLDSSSDPNMTITPELLSRDGAPIDGFMIYWSDSVEESSDLRQCTVDFTGNIPDSLIFSCKVGTTGFAFNLNFDPTLMQQGETVSIDQSFVLDGQNLAVTTVEIYPTHVRLNLNDNEGNTAWLKSLQFYLEDESGRQFKPISSGITATGSADSPMMNTFMLESAFFSDSKDLTLCITGASWLDHDMTRGKVNLAEETADQLPEGVSLESAVREGEDWLLSFTGERRGNAPLHQLFDMDYFDKAGNKYSVSSYSTTSLGNFDATKEGSQEQDDQISSFDVKFTLKDYPYDVVYLAPSVSHSTELKTPIKIKVK